MEEIKTEQNNESSYYEEVKRVTKDFSSLKDFPEGSKIRKDFISQENYNEFVNLIMLVQLGLNDKESEFERIERLLKYNIVTGENRRILEARKAVIEKEEAREDYEEER
ncbi:MAG: hypothetical protein Q4G09_01605 [Clostridia bacterium]|nr:hypothetical protein [Clostridia bacterium]